MVSLTNLSTGLDEDVPDDKAGNAIQSGGYSAPKKPITLVSPETNEAFEISNPEKANAALRSGWTPESKDQLLTRVVRNNPNITGPIGALAAFGNAFSNQAFLGIPEVERENTGSEGDKKLYKEIDTQLAEQHSGFNIAGGLLGTASTLLLTPVGKALGYFGDAAVNTVTKAAAYGGETAAKVAASSVVKAGVKLGAENVALNLPYRIDESRLGDPNIAHEGILAHSIEDFGTGALLGGGGSLLGSTIKGAAGIASKVINPETLQYEANISQLKNIGVLTGGFSKLDKVLGEDFTPNQLQSSVDFLDENVPQSIQLKGATATADRLKSIKLRTSRDLAGIQDAVDKAAPDSISSNQVNNIFDAVEKENMRRSISPQAGPGIADFGSLTADEYSANIQKYGSDPSQWPTSPQTATPSIDPINNPELKVIGELRKAYMGTLTEKLRGQGLNDLQIQQQLDAGNFPNVGMNDMFKYTQLVKPLVYGEGTNVINSNAGKDILTSLRSLMDDTTNQVASKTNNPQLLNSFKPALETHGEVKLFLKDILKNAGPRELARNRFGLTSAILGSTGHIVGGAPGAAAGLAIGYIKQHYGNYLMYQTLGTAAKALESISSKVDNSIVDLLSSDTAKSTKANAAVGSVGVFSRYHNDDKITPVEGFKKFKNDLNYAQSSPQSISDTLSAIVPNFAEFAPQNYTMMGATTQNAIQYLQDTAPKSPAPIYVGGPVRPWEPSDSEISKYARRIHAVFNPLSILDEMKAGTLTTESVEAVSAVYPNLYKAIAQKVQEKLASAPPAQVYKIRQKLGKILLSSNDPQTEAIRITGLQAGFAPNNNHVKPQANSKITEDNRYTTDIDRVSNE